MSRIIVGLAVLMHILGVPDSAEQGKQKVRNKVEYRVVDTQSFTIEVPSGWTVSEETPWGSRQIRPSDETNTVKAASMSSMTGPGLGRQSWDRLYQTSLYFITRNGRESKMKATPYTLGKSKQGFETCSWDMTDTAGTVIQRHVILKHSNGNILALSVKVPADATKEERAQLCQLFQHMVDTAIVK